MQPHNKKPWLIVVGRLSYLLEKHHIKKHSMLLSNSNVSNCFHEDLGRLRFQLCDSSYPVYLWIKIVLWLMDFFCSNLLVNVLLWFTLMMANLALWERLQRSNQRTKKKNISSVPSSFDLAGGKVPYKNGRGLSWNAHLGESWQCIMYRRLASLWRTAKSAATNGYVINPEQGIAREDWAGPETLPANYRGTAGLQEKCTAYGTQSKIEHLTYGPMQFTLCTAKRLQRGLTEVLHNVPY